MLKNVLKCAKKWKSLQIFCPRLYLCFVLRLEDIALHCSLSNSFRKGTRLCNSHRWWWTQWRVNFRSWWWCWKGWGDEMIMLRMNTATRKMLLTINIWRLFRPLINVFDLTLTKCVKDICESSKVADQWAASLLNISLFHKCFPRKLLGFSISGKLAWSELNWKLPAVLKSQSDKAQRYSMPLWLLLIKNML